MMNVIHDKTLSYSSAFMFVMREFMKLLEKDFSPHEMIFSNGSWVSFIKQDEEVVSAVVWHYDEPRRVLNISLVATAEEHKQKGFYSAIYNELEKQGRKLGAKAVYFSTHVDNSEMQAASTKLTQYLYRYRKLL